MRSLFAALVLLLLAMSAAHAQAALGTKGAPEPSLGYTLAAWPSFLRKIGGEGSIVGFVSKTGYALGVGHAFKDYKSTLGTVVFTVGPALYVPFNASRGLRDGQIRLFVSIAIVPARSGT